MKYKISNIASIHVIENHTNSTFKHPKLYQQKRMITGKEETIVPIITSEYPNEIDFAIWGLLPDKFDQDWNVFQEHIDTLTVKIDNIRNDFMQKELNIRPCLVIVTGFYTSFLENGKIQEYYITKENNTPFYLAGCYNQLNDGFLTFSLLLKKQKKELKKFQNLDKYIPIVIDETMKQDWLSNKISITDLKKVSLLQTKLKILKNTHGIQLNEC